MRVLMVAYACLPGRGSEMGVGWEWALGVRRLGHEAWVLTRHCYRQRIEAALERLPEAERPRFVYCDPTGCRRFYEEAAPGVQLFYYVWQWAAALCALRLHREARFDLVHHVTLASVRPHSMLWLLRAPFFFGPVGGGERAPWPLRRSCSLPGWLIDALRDLWSLAVTFDPFRHVALARAARIFVTTKESRNLIPAHHWPRTRIQQIGGVDCAEDGAACCRPVAHRSARDGPLRLLHAGNFLHWKGMDIGLRALARAIERSPGRITLTMVGRGREEARWRRLSRELGIEGAVEWIPWVEKRGLCSLFAAHDASLLPSLHDATSMVLLESLAHGLPAVCLGLGGPGRIADGSCGLVVPVDGLSLAAVCEALSDALLRIAFLPGPELELLSRGAVRRAHENRWQAAISALYAEASAVVPITRSLDREDRPGCTDSR